MINFLKNLFAPRINFEVRHIGLSPLHNGSRQAHMATSWLTKRCWKTYRVGDLVEVTEGITLVVKEVKHLWNEDIDSWILLDFATRFPANGCDMKKLGFYFYHHGGDTSWLRPTQQEMLAA